LLPLNPALTHVDPLKNSHVTIEQLKPPDGDADNAAVPPVQMVVVPDAVTVGSGSTVITTLPEVVGFGLQPLPEQAYTALYVVVVVGETDTELPETPALTHIDPLKNSHETAAHEVPPLGVAESVALPPVQIVVEPPALTVGSLLTVIETEADVTGLGLQPVPEQA